MNAVYPAQNLAVLSELTVHQLEKLEDVGPAPWQRHNSEADHKNKRVKQGRSALLIQQHQENLQISRRNLLPTHSHCVSMHLVMRCP